MHAIDSDSKNTHTYFFLSICTMTSHNQTLPAQGCLCEEEDATSGFIQQRDRFSCGQVALVNAFYWKYNKYPFEAGVAGYPERVLRHLRWRMQNVQSSTDPAQMEATHMLRLGPRCRCPRKILALHAFILLYSFTQALPSNPDRWRAHYVFVRREGSDFIICNNWGCTQKRLDRPSFAARIFAHQPGPCPPNNPLFPWAAGVRLPLAWEILA
jgi:hypothetical protein